MMKCPRCQNTDPAWFYPGSKGWYCRRCISFGRILIEEERNPVPVEEIREGSEEYLLRYPLTPAQKVVSDACVSHIFSTDVLLECVCGAGKTEMTVASIAAFLKLKKKVCFAIARRQVVLEVAERLGQYFPNARVVPVCQGFTTITDGDLIVCTTHQLYRYYQTFDLLILDEPDAFPFRGDPVLHGIAASACIGHIIYLTATPDDYLKQGVKEGKIQKFVLSVRPHGKPIPVPVVRLGPLFLLFPELFFWLRKHTSHPRIVFVPTIAGAEVMGRILSVFFTPCKVVTSKSENRDVLIETFRKEQKGIMVATTVLERGVTIPHADVCVFEADHGVYDEAGLVQMAGRAGRDFKDPTGDVLFLCRKRSDLCEACKTSLEEANKACVV